MTTNTFPGWLQFQANSRSKVVAVRHKHLGIWHEKSWGELHHDLLGLVVLLQQKGFQKGDTLYCISHPRLEALLLSIAAQWLGGVAAPLNPDDVSLPSLIDELKPDYVFAEGQKQVDLLNSVGLSPELLVYADYRGLSGNGQTALVSYATYAGAAIVGQIEPPVAIPMDSAFLFHRYDTQGLLQVQKLSHDQMLEHGRKLVKQERINADEEALAARTFAASGHVRYLLAPWLIAGFKLNFPENIDTRDIDRRELGPTLVAGTSETYQRLESLIKSRLPLPDSFLRKIYDWALSTGKRSSFSRAFGYFLIVKPLRDVIGFSRIRIPLLVGEALPESSFIFFQTLGIEVRNWPEIVEWQKLDGDEVRNKLIEPGNNKGQQYLTLNERAGVTV